MPWNEVVFHGEWKANESAGGPGHGDEPRGNSSHILYE